MEVFSSTHAQKIEAIDNKNFAVNNFFLKLSAMENNIVKVRCFIVNSVPFLFKALIFSICSYLHSTSFHLTNSV